MINMETIEDVRPVASKTVYEIVHIMEDGTYRPVSLTKNIDDAVLYLNSETPPKEIPETEYIDTLILIVIRRSLQQISYGTVGEVVFKRVWHRQGNASGKCNWVCT